MVKGGATVWRQKILMKYKHIEIKSKWAIFEDVIYSYPLGKKYPLYICRASIVKLDESFKNRDDIFTSLYKGKTEFLWGYYFVHLNPDLSKDKYLFYHFLHVIYKIIKKRRIQILFEGFGALLGGIIVFNGIYINKKNQINLIEKYT